MNYKKKSEKSKDLSKTDSRLISLLDCLNICVSKRSVCGDDFQQDLYNQLGASLVVIYSSSICRCSGACRRGVLQIVQSGASLVVGDSFSSNVVSVPHTWQ